MNKIMDKFKVMIVEDDKIAREQLAKIIEKEGFEICTAEDGKIGLEIFMKEPHDIVVTDLKLPGMDGLELMHSIKRISPQTEVILVTAFGESDTAIMALQAGALDYINKPIDLEALLVAMGRAKEKLSFARNLTHYPAILLAEDDSLYRASLARVLEKEGWKVHQAANGEEAIQIFIDKKIDIALLDIKMPKKDGLETLQEMRKISDDFESIILTGYGDESNAIRAMRCGAKGFIKKPVDLDHLIVSVEKAMDDLNASRALKFRKRDLKISNEIISIIMSEEGILLEIRNKEQHKENLIKNIKKLLEAIPLGIGILDQNYNIKFYNSMLKNLVNSEPKKFDQEFVEQLKKNGITIVFEKLQDLIKKAFEATETKWQRLDINKYGYITVVLVSLQIDDKKRKMVLLAIRGERK